MSLRLLARMSETPWAITPSMLEQMLSIAERENLDPESVAKQLGRPLENTYKIENRDGIAILPVTGPLLRYANMFTRVSGATSYEMLARDFAEALENPEIAAIILNIDSPGGDANGLAEFADQIYNARDLKTIIAYVGGTAASAAYWVASAAEMIVVSETAILGSIGVVLDLVVKDAPPGERRYEIVSSQSPDKRVDPSTEGGSAKYQKITDDLASIFIGRVARNRKVSEDHVMGSFGQGDLMIASRAMLAGMADKFGSFEGLISDLHAITRKFRVPPNDDGGAESATQRNLDMTQAVITQPEITTAAQLRERYPALVAQLETESANTERGRVLGILNSPETKGREALAAVLASRPNMSKEDAEAFLSAAPKAFAQEVASLPTAAAPTTPAPAAAPPAAPASATDTGFTAAMEALGNPKIGADNDTPLSAEDAAVARSVALGKMFGCE